MSLVNSCWYSVFTPSGVAGLRGGVRRVASGSGPWLEKIAATAEVTVCINIGAWVADRAPSPTLPYTQSTNIPLILVCPLASVPQWAKIRRTRLLVVRVRYYEGPRTPTERYPSRTSGRMGLFTFA